MIPGNGLIIQKFRNIRLLLLMLYFFQQPLFSMQLSQPSQDAVDLSDYEGVLKNLKDNQGLEKLVQYLQSKNAAKKDANVILAIEAGYFNSIQAILEPLKPLEKLNFLRLIARTNKISLLTFAVAHHADLENDTKINEEILWASRKMIITMVSHFSEQQFIEILTDASQDQSPIAMVAKKGALSILRDFIDKLPPGEASPFIETFREQGLSLFELAMMNNKTACALRLLREVSHSEIRRGMLHSRFGQDGETILMRALRAGLYRDVLQILRDQSSDERIELAKLQNGQGQSLFYILVCLIKNNTENASNARKHPAAPVLVPGGELNLSYLVLEEIFGEISSADLQEFMKTNRTGLQYSARKNLKPVLEFLFAKLTNDQVLHFITSEEAGQDFFMDCVSEGENNESVSLYLLDRLEKGFSGHQMAAYIEKKDHDGGTLFFYALCPGAMEFPRRLLRLGANPLCQNLLGQTAMHRMAANDWPCQIIFLSQFPELTEKPDAEGRTPLRTAIRFSSYNAIRTLLKQGARVEAFDQNGKAMPNPLGLCFLQKEEEWARNFTVFYDENDKFQEAQSHESPNKPRALCLLPQFDYNNAFDIGNLQEECNLFFETHEVRVKRAPLQAWSKEIQSYGREKEIDCLSLSGHGRPFFMSPDEEMPITADFPQFCPGCFEGVVAHSGTIFLRACLAGKPMQEEANLLEIFAMLCSPRVVVGCCECFSPRHVFTSQTLPTWDVKILQADGDKTVRLRAIPIPDKPGFFCIKSLRGSCPQARFWMNGQQRSLRGVTLPVHNH